MIAGFVPDAGITRGRARKSDEVKDVGCGLELRRALSVAEDVINDFDPRSPEDVGEDCKELVVLDGFAVLVVG